MNDTFPTALPDKSHDERLSKLRNKFLMYPLGQGFQPSDVPWKTSGRGYELGVVGLHNEIKDFYNFIKPTYDDQYAREVVVSRIKDVAHDMWPDCKVDVFGSFKTGLYLPTSDIDMVIFGKWKALPLRTLEKALLRSGLSSEITVLDKATVPIVKMTDRETGLRVDISFNMINSVKAAELIRFYIQTFPCLPYLVFVLKQFLLQRRLNEVWTGGLSSYALILMVVRFLQDKFAPNWTSEGANLGVLLLEFFELYGRLFNYTKTAIRVVDGGEYVRKEVVLQNMVHGVRPSILCIEDPLCPGNDVGRRSYQALLIKQAFERAYVVLSSAVLPQYCFLHGRTDESILGLIIRVSETTLECRQRIRDYSMHLLNNPKPPSSTNELEMQRDSSPLPTTVTSAPITFPIARLPHMYSLNFPLLPLPGIVPFPPNLNVPPVPPHTAQSWQLHNVPPRLVLQFTPVIPQPQPVIAETKDVVSPTDTDIPTTLSPASDAGSTTTESSSTQSTVLENKVEKQVKSCEDSVLAKDFASLSTVIRSDSQSNMVPSEKDGKLAHFTTQSEDCKRRCLRSVSPTKSIGNHSNDDDVGRTIQSRSDSSVNSNKAADQSAELGETSVKVMETPNGSISSGKPGKQSSKARHQPHSTVHTPTNVRENHYSRFVNRASSTIPCGQKRHAPGSRRLK